MRHLLPVVLVLAACGPVPPERAHEICEQRARAAQGPTGELRMGVNSLTGPSIGGEISVSSDFLAGLDPLQVYERCIFERTGAPATRQPDLR